MGGHYKKVIDYQPISHRNHTKEIIGQRKKTFLVLNQSELNIESTHLFWLAESLIQYSSFNISEDLPTPLEAASQIVINENRIILYNILYNLKLLCSIIYIKF